MIGTPFAIGHIPCQVVTSYVVRVYVEGAHPLCVCVSLRVHFNTLPRPPPFSYPPFFRFICRGGGVPLKRVVLVLHQAPNFHIRTEKTPPPPYHSVTSIHRPSAAGTHFRIENKRDCLASTSLAIISRALDTFL